MKKIFTILTTLLCLVGVYQKTNAEERIESTEVTNSGCTRSEDSSDERKINWQVSYQDGILTFTWFDFWANCCPEGFTAWIDKIDETTLVFNVRSNEDLCSCMCSFDVTASYQGIGPGTYTIVFRDAWIDEYFTTEVTIEEGCDYKFPQGTIGIRQFEESNDMIRVSAEGVLHVLSQQPVSLEIYDAAGVLRAKMDMSPDSDLDLTSLRSGIYLAKATSGNRTSTLRFVR